MDIIGYLATILMGFILGLMGGGGSILTIPILVYFFQIDPVKASGYSLFIVGLTSLLGGGTYYLKGNVNIKIGIIFAIPSLIAVYLTRVLFIPWLPDILISTEFFTISKAFLMMVVFAIIMIGASVSMIRTKSPHLNLPQKSKLFFKYRFLVMAFEGIVVGALMGFVGAGGGFLIVPTLVLLVGLSMKVAIGTSLLIIAINSLMGFIGEVQTQSSMDWTFLLSVTGISFLGLFVGMKFSPQIPEAILKKCFGYFVFMMGTFILIGEIKSLY